MNIEKTIRDTLMQTLSDQGSQLNGTLEAHTVLLETGLDSLGFAILVTKLEDELGYDPFVLSDTPFYPKTFGEFVGFYKKFANVA